MKPSPMRIAVVAAEFNRPLVDAMIAAASDEASKHGAVVDKVVRVPGCYEVPIVAKHLCARAELGAIVVLGYIERGETQHGEVMGHVVHRALMKLSLAHDKPMGLGIIGPGATAEQADSRKDAYARAAVRAALAAHGALQTT
jgi:6,7-dimethyl-8-ribityllumazine synthase